MVSFQGLKKIWWSFGPRGIRGNCNETGCGSNEGKRLYRSRRFRDIVFQGTSFMKPDLEHKVHQIYEVVGFRPVGPYTLEVEFSDGISRKIDFEGVLEGELYGPLKDTAVFQQVKLDHERGNLVWPNGADFDPEILHDWPERKAAMMAVAVRWRRYSPGYREVYQRAGEVVPIIWYVIMVLHRRRYRQLHHAHPHGIHYDDIARNCRVNSRRIEFFQ